MNEWNVQCIGCFGFWRGRRAEVSSNLGPSAYASLALYPLSQRSQRFIGRCSSFSSYVVFVCLLFCHQRSSNWPLSLPSCVNPASSNIHTLVIYWIVGCFVIGSFSCVVFKFLFELKEKVPASSLIWFTLFSDFFSPPPGTSKTLPGPCGRSE